MALDHPLTSPPSQSYIHPTPSIPTTPSLLSRQNSSSFFTSTPHPHHLTTTTTTRSHPGTPGTKPHRRRRRRYENDGADEDWLIRTASHLTMSRLEEKGVSWLVARESSTSLVDGGEEIAVGEEYGLRGSREQSRASLFGNGGGGGGGRKSRRGSAGSKGGMVAGVMMGGPDFVDERDEREMRDVLGTGDVGLEVEGDENEDGDGDGEGMMVVEDEREMRRVVMGRIGGWVDWAVGWLDLGDGVEGDLDVEEEGYGEQSRGFAAGAEGELDVEEVKRRLGAKAGVEGQEGIGERDDWVLPPPPAGDQAGILSDARWLLTIAGKLAV